MCIILDLEWLIFAQIIAFILTKETQVMQLWQIKLKLISLTFRFPALGSCEGLASAAQLFPPSDTFHCFHCELLKDTEALKFPASINLSNYFPLVLAIAALTLDFIPNVI